MIMLEFIKLNAFKLSINPLIFSSMLHILHNWIQLNMYFTALTVHRRQRKRESCTNYLWWSYKQWNDRTCFSWAFLFAERCQKKWNKKFALLGARWRGSGEAIPTPKKGANPVSIFYSESFPVGIGKKELI